MSRELRNVGASVRARLANLARERGEDFQRVLQRYVTERLLARLADSAHRGRFVLKGAMLYVVWGGVFQRPTRDLDLLGSGDSTPEAMHTVFQSICGMQSEADGVRYDLETLVAEPIRESAERSGVRVRVDAYLEQARVPLQVDIVFGEVVVPEALEVEFPLLLEPGALRLKGYPHEVVLAEKFHAAVALGELNSRLKDFYDLCVLPQLFLLDDEQVGSALRATFERRGTALPGSTAEALPESFFREPVRAERWRALLDRDGLTMVLRDFEQVGEQIRAALEGGLAVALRLAEHASKARGDGER